MFNLTTSAPSKLAMVNTLTAQLMKHRPEWFNRSKAMKAAWSLVNKEPDAKLLVFRKKKGNEITRRIVFENWSKYQAPKGGKSTLAPGQRVFADAAKVVAYLDNCLISTFPEQIEYFA